MSSLTDDRIVRLCEVASFLGVTNRTLLNWRKLGILPTPIKIGPRAKGYRESTLRKFLDDRGGAA